MTNHKLGIVVPYRDRYEHLIQFKKSISNYLKSKDIEYVLIIVEQDDAKLFNRGKLLNIGFLRAVKEKCDYVVFHDVDMLPINVDYGYSDVPIHLATDLMDSNSTYKREIFDTYFGGVTMFPVKDFTIINGYSNDYWGWGYEDDDLFKRCIFKGVLHDIKDVNTEGGSNVSLRFNGVNSYIKTRFKGNISDKVTIVVNAHPNGVICDETKGSDRYTILSIPEIKMTLSYDSFRRYKLLIDEGDDQWLYIDTDIVDNYKTTLIITIDNVLKKVKLYCGGKLLGTKKLNNSLTELKEGDLFIGTKEGETEYFNGDISMIGIYNKILSPKDIEEVSFNEGYSLTMPFGGYKSHGDIVQYYDMKNIKDYRVVDLCDFKNNAEIVNCEVVKSDMVKITPINVPFRRVGYFNLLSHKSSGYDGGEWSDINIRYNQLRYHNEMEKGYRDYMNDGLSNCEYKTWDETKLNKQIHLLVSI